MQQLKSLCPETSTSTETQSSDNRQFAEKQADWHNAEIGHLNEADGIDCPKCKNKGTIAFAKQAYEDCDRMEMYITKCECMKQRTSVRNAKNSGMGNLLQNTVNGYQADDDWQKEVKAKVAKYCQSSNDEWLAILGETGAGKTHLCSAVANYYIKQGYEVRYVVWGVIAKELKHDMFSPTGSRQLLGKLQRVKVLYIDDLLKGVYNDQDISLLFDLINYRYSNDLITLITSERLFGELMDIDSAIAGRIKEKAKDFIIQIIGDGKNYRLKAI